MQHTRTSRLRFTGSRALFCCSLVVFQRLTSMLLLAPYQPFFVSDATAKSVLLAESEKDAAAAAFLMVPLRGRPSRSHAQVSQTFLPSHERIHTFRAPTATFLCTFSNNSYFSLFLHDFFFLLLQHPKPFVWCTFRDRWGGFFRFLTHTRARTHDWSFHGKKHSFGAHSFTHYSFFARRRA